MHVKAAVEQPIFVTPLAAIAKRTAATMTAQPIDKVAMNKLATALREQPADQQAVGSLGARRWRYRSTKVAGCARRVSSPSPRATSRPRAHSSSAPPRLATLARLLRSATRSTRRPSPVSASSGSRAMKPKRATIMRARSPPARPGLVSGSPLWRRNSALFRPVSRPRQARAPRARRPSTSLRARIIQGLSCSFAQLLRLLRRSCAPLLRHEPSPFVALLTSSLKNSENETNRSPRGRPA